jgi:hypothetical protein
MAHVELAETLRGMFERVMYDDLADKRRVNGSRAYSKRWICEYLDKKRDHIDRLVSQMIDDYEQNNELNDLTNPCDEQIHEYLYDGVIGLVTIHRARGGVSGHRDM